MSTPTAEQVEALRVAARADVVALDCVVGADPADWDAAYAVAASKVAAYLAARNLNKESTS
jgi:hypothetical protein